MILRHLRRIRNATFKRRFATQSSETYAERISKLDRGPNGINSFVSNVRVPAERTSKLGPTNGYFIAIKDNICTSVFPTSCASAFLEEFNPGYDATVVSLLEEAGGHVIGKTNCDEFGMGSFTTNTVHGPTINPWILQDPSSSKQPRSAGGSSGGSAAAVAASFCDAALGTDTGGSIRLPASYCGIAGFKPSYGMVSRWGVVSYADSLDCVGVLAKSVTKARQVNGVISKYDQKDPTAVSDEIRQRANDDVASILSRASDGLSGLRIGVPEEYFPKELDPSLRQQFKEALVQLKQLGAEVISVSLPSTKYALSAYYVLATAEASSNLGRYDGVRFGKRVKPDDDEPISSASDIYALSRSAGFGAEVRKRILLGTYALTADAFDNYFLQAQRIRKAIREDFDKVFSSDSVLRAKTDAVTSAAEVDLLLHPTAIGPAPPLDQSFEGVDGYMQDILTTPASLAGLPCLSVPLGLSTDGWPLGLSIVGQWGHDELVLSFGERYEGVFGKLSIH